MTHSYRKISLCMMLVIAVVALVTGCQTTANHDCPFCAIIAGKAPATVVYENAEIIVVEKNHPVDGVDCLIIPKKHIVDLRDLDMTNQYDATLLNNMQNVACKHLSKMITKNGDFQLVSNNGKDAGQSVFHMHWHFKAPLSRWKKDVKAKQVSPAPACMKTLP